MAFRLNQFDRNFVTTGEILKQMAGIVRNYRW